MKWMLCGILLLAYLPSFATKKPSHLDQVKAYCAAHHSKMTVHQGKEGYWWVEGKNLDPFGVAKTVDEAAENFLKSAEMMDSETNHPILKSAPGRLVACPSDQDCI